jgi:hypothetical protein
MIEETLNEYRQVFMKTRQQFATLIAVSPLSLHPLETFLIVDCSVGRQVPRGRW